MSINSNVINKLRVISNEGLKILSDHNLLKSLVERLITSDVTKDVTYDKDLFDDLRKQIIKKQGFKSKEEYSTWLNKCKLTEEKFFEDIHENLKWTTYCNSTFGHMTEALFLKKSDDLDFATYSLIRVQDIYLSNELFLRIKEGEANFGDISAKYSIGAEKDTKGIVGPAPVSQGHPAIRELIRTSQIGVVQEPKRIENQFVIFRLESLKKAILDENTKKALAQELFVNWLEDETNEIIHSLEVK